MILSSSSINVGINLNEIVIIIANSCAGTPIFFKGFNKFSIASVNCIGEVVNVSKLEKIISNINLKLIKIPNFIPSSVNLKIKISAKISPSCVKKCIKSVNKIIQLIGFNDFKIIFTGIFDKKIAAQVTAVKKM